MNKCYTNGINCVSKLLSKQPQSTKRLLLLVTLFLLNRENSSLQCFMIQKTWSEINNSVQPGGFCLYTIKLQGVPSVESPLKMGRCYASLEIGVSFSVDQKISNGIVHNIFLLWIIITAFVF